MLARDHPTSSPGSPDAVARRPLRTTPTPSATVAAEHTQEVVRETADATEHVDPRR